MINIIDKKNCCGCTACESVCPKKCITMTCDDEGFKYPVVDTTNCINCNLCETVCPIINNNISTNTIPQTAYIMRNNNLSTVSDSTSGGVVSAFCNQIISEGGIVFGGAYDKDFNVCHMSAETEKEAEKFKSSKYVQSDLSDTFIRIKKELQSNRKVMFVGTPCQVAGLVHFLRKPYDNLFTVDFACHGVPSPKLWKKYRDMLIKKNKSPIVYANFREKTYGYNSSNLSIKFANGKKSVGNTLTDCMLKSYFDGLSSRPSCYGCSFRPATRHSDITVFDCWNITYYYPNIANDNIGHTSVLVQNDKGNKMIDKIKDKVIMYPVNSEKLINKDGVMIVRNPALNPKRDQFYKMLNNDVPIDVIMKKLSPVKLSRKIFGKLKSFLYKTGILKLMKKLK